MAGPQRRGAAGQAGERSNENKSNDGRSGGRGRGRDNRRSDDRNQYLERVVAINRVAKVVLRARDAELVADARVVGEVTPDGGQVDDSVDPEGNKVRGGADP